MSFLKQHATTVHLTSALDRSEIEMFFQPYKVLLFPFNKEIHSLVRFNHLTNFNIYSIADVRMTGRVNKKVNQLINQTADMIIGDLVIQRYASSPYLWLPKRFRLFPGCGFLCSK